MKKDDIRLLAQARAGSESARVALGGRYLIGDRDIHRNVSTGVDYLLNPSPTPATLRVLAESLDLNEFVTRGLLHHLETAAVLRTPAALVKSAIWRLLGGHPVEKARQLLEHAKVSPDDHASHLLLAMQTAGAGARPTAAVASVLRTAQSLGLLRAVDVALTAARAHWQSDARSAFALCVRVAASLDTSDGEEVHALVAKLLDLAGGDPSLLSEVSPRLLSEHLERRVTAADPKACYVLGLLLSGMNYRELPAAALGVKPNSRRGAALLLRSAHHGIHAAWMDLHHVHSGKNRSVANAEMARLCLEKAAEHGSGHAQRKLGALLLKDASSPQESETAIGWLHKAHLQGDAHATTLLRSLTAPVFGNDVDAQRAIHAIAQRDPLLAGRLRLARALGLTLHEALSVDPSRGIRAWGLVVDPNPQLRKRRIASGRCVPVVNDLAMAELRATVSPFANQQPNMPQALAEGEFRKRYFRLRYFLNLVGARNELFFASLTAAHRESLSGGRTWATRVRRELSLALRTGPSSLSASLAQAPSPSDDGVHREALAA